MEKYFRIGEISKLYGIGVDSLRYYEKLGLIHPKRSESGYRLYSIHDIWCLNVIRDLRGLDFSMEQISDYLAFHTVDSTLKLLKEERDTIAEKIKNLRQLYDNVEHRMQTIRLANQKTAGAFKCRHFPARRCYCIQDHYTSDEEMDILIKRLLNLDKNRFYVIGSNQIGSTIPLKRAKNGEFGRYSSVFLTDPKGDHLLPEGDYVTVCYRGSCKQNTDYIPALFRYADEHGFQPVGDILEILWIDIHTSAVPDEHVTELQLQVQKLP